MTAATVRRAARPAIEDWILENDHLRLTLKADSLALSAEELATGTHWPADLWEGSAGRLRLRSRDGDSLVVNLAAARRKHIEPLPPGEGAAGKAAGAGLRLGLSQFRTRLGPVRRDRGIEGHLTLELQIRLAADRPEFVCRIERLENTSPYWQFETLEWPLRTFPVRTVDDDGYVAVPQEQGFIIPSRFGDVGHFRYLNWVWDRVAGQAAVLDNTSMPWFGAKKGESAFLCILETMDDAAIGAIGNDVRPPGAPPAAPSAVPVPGATLFAPRLSAVWPLWRSVKGELAYPRVARYTFLPRGGYVEMCKTYRRYARETGRFVTLCRKIEQNPLVERLIGAPHVEVQLVANHPRQPEYQGLSGAIYDGYHHVNTTFPQVEAMVRDLRQELGIERAVLLLAGWGQAGYDNFRPIDTLPVNEEAGGPEQLRRAVQAGKDAGYLIGLFDNYRNLDLLSPSYDERYIVREAGGALHAGFSSEGGHSQQICTQEAVHLFRRNMERFVAEFGPNVHYLDTVGGLPFFECYDRRHPLTRSEDREQKGALMRVATDAGLVLGAEGQPRDWNLPIAAFYEEHPVRIGIDVPLYHLVYHECAVLYWQHGMPYNYGLDNYGHVRGTLFTKFLRGLLYGDPPSWVFTDRSYRAWRSTFKAINDIVAAHHRRVAHDELVDHRLLTPDLLVQRTRFSSGVEVTVNYGEFPYQLEDGTALPAHGYRIVDPSPDGRSSRGHLAIQCVTEHAGTE
ncbi:MAG: hypothetical protein HY332_08105 [Chloroflexi bacterium]|nr:hypothetical protein [Chloroflexota bacterium]